MPSKARYTRRRRGGSGARTNRASISRLSPSSESNEAAKAEKNGRAVAVKADEAAGLALREAAFARRAALKVIAIVEEIDRSDDSSTSSDDEDADKRQQRDEGKKFKRVVNSRYSTYSGEVKGRYNDAKHGFGQLKTGSSTYQGEWKDNKEDGFGVFVVTPSVRHERTGYRYEGQFKAGKMTGHGVCVYSSGDIYRGHHLDDQFDGYGVYLHIQTTGGVSKCEFKGGVKDGFGTYDSDLLSHSGLFSNDSFVRGRGTIVLATGSYTGDLKKFSTVAGTLKHGKGRFVYANGDVYEGQFKKDKKYGNGKLTMQNGTVQEGIWSGDRLTGEVTQVGHPTLHGEFVSGVPLTPFQADTYSGDDTDPDK